MLLGEGGVCLKNCAIWVTLVTLELILEYLECCYSNNIAQIPKTLQITQFFGFQKNKKGTKKYNFQNILFSFGILDLLVFSIRLCSGMKLV